MPAAADGGPAGGQERGGRQRRRDPGTPGVSDPGWILLRFALDEGLEADVLPGPSALLPALLLSGLTPHPFLRIVGFHWTRPGLTRPSVPVLRTKETARPADRRELL